MSYHIISYLYRTNPYITTTTTTTGEIQIDNLNKEKYDIIKSNRDNEDKKDLQIRLVCSFVL